MFTFEQIEEASENCCGFCVACGEEQGGCEPDADGYECESCGKRTVYGSDNIVIMFPHLVGGEDEE